MTRFYFNIYNYDVTPDDERAELADAHAAHAYAIKAARSLAAEMVSNGRLGLKHRIEIEDEAHAVVGTVTFADAVEVRQS